MMRKAAFVVEAPPKSGVAPFLVEGRTTTGDFFAMFDVPFMYGGGWDQAADDASQMVVVLSKKANDKAFGGADSVGQTVRLDGHDFKVVGVLDEWAPTPKLYDPNNGAFDEIEELFAVRHRHAVRDAERRQHELLARPADQQLPGLPQQRLCVDPVLGGVPR